MYQCFEETWYLIFRVEEYAKQANKHVAKRNKVQLMDICLLILLFETEDEVLLKYQ
jgi:hypothetical protein